MYTFNTSSWEADDGRSLWVLGQTRLQSNLQDSQEYTEKMQSQNKNKQTEKQNIKQQYKPSESIEDKFLQANM